MRHRRPFLGISLAGALLLAGLTACAPTPEPTPTATALFASDDEAFAAAEQLFRDYIEAENVWRTNPEGEDPLDFLTGHAYEDALAERRSMEATGLRTAGETHVASVVPDESDVAIDAARVTVKVCLDLSENTVVDADGMEVATEERLQQALLEADVLLTAEITQITEVRLVERKC